MATQEYASMEQARRYLEEHDGICAKCRFFDATDHLNANNQLTGVCRRHAPVPRIGTIEFRDSTEAYWPEVDGVDWCGEFKEPDEPRTAWDLCDEPTDESNTD